MLVALLHNAVSAEDSAADRDVLVQAEAVEKALDQLGHKWVALPCTLDLGAVRTCLGQIRPNVVFNLVESLGGSDWVAHALTALLDSLGIGYTGSPTEALLLTNHKLLAKDRLRQSGLPTPDWLAPRPGSRHSGEPRCQPAPLAPVYMIKAVCEHASFGLDEQSLIRSANREELEAAIGRHAARLQRPCFAEAFVDGREFNLSLLASEGGPEVLPCAEIDFSAFPPGKARIVGQSAKWEEGSFEFQSTPRRFDFPAADQPLLERLRDLAARCWELFDLGGYVRVDFRVDRQGQPWILEINTNPCLSPDAGFAAALAQAAIPWEATVARILDDALARRSIRG